MKLTDISKEELETMNYDDIAYIILNENKKAEKINVLFKSVCDALNLSEAEYEAKIADFFELLTTDKRFIMLEDGSWDLRELHNPEVIIDDEDDEETIIDVEETINEAEEEEETDIFYDADNDDDLPDDDLEDLVVIDVDEEEANN
ncbi:MAG: DNA-directed RNA polymerase subunit delta [Bacilli bacterium]|jgi:DNA-directed RNA polymerase subunit delta|nr:DNA-directed RNA polymerase subunit delta [Bacilli bacterium]